MTNTSGDWDFQLIVKYIIHGYIGKKVSVDLRTYRCKDQYYNPRHSKHDPLNKIQWQGYSEWDLAQVVGRNNVILSTWVQIPLVACSLFVSWLLTRTIHDSIADGARKLLVQSHSHYKLKGVTNCIQRKKEWHDYAIYTIKAQINTQSPGLNKFHTNSWPFKHHFLINVYEIETQFQN